MNVAYYQYAADVSSNNGVISIPSYSRAGHAVLIIKATQGTSYVNPDHFEQANLAHEFGITVVHYHFVEPGDNQAQIDHFRNVYIRAWRKGDYVCGDFEVDGLTGSSTSDFLRKLHAETTHEPILYTYKSFLENQLRGAVVPGKRLWLADYSDVAPTYDKNLYKLWAWQYTDGKDGPPPHFYTGIGNCDGSIVSRGPAFALHLRKIRTARKR